MKHRASADTRFFLHSNSQISLFLKYTVLSSTIQHEFLFCSGNYLILPIHVEWELFAIILKLIPLTVILLHLCFLINIICAKKALAKSFQMFPISYISSPAISTKNIYHNKLYIKCLHFFSIARLRN